MKDIFKKTFILFLVCALFLTGGALNAASAYGGPPQPKQYKVSYEYNVSGVDYADRSKLPSLPGASWHKQEDNVTIAEKKTSDKYIFEGWFTDDVRNLSPDAASFTMPGKDVKFTGKWIKGYTATYIFDGPAPFNVPLKSQLYKSGQTIELPTITAPTGYSFDGWYRQGGGNDKITSYKFRDHNVTFVGHWTKENVPTTYSVSYIFTNEPFPEDGLTLEAPHDYAPNELVSIASTPVFSGYSFTPWIPDQTLEITEGQFSMPESGVVFSCTWSRVEPDPEPTPSREPFYIVNYVYNGVVPVGAPALPAVNYYYWGTTAHVAPVPQLMGYVFSGWTTTNVNVVNGTFTVPQNSVTFTGTWVVATTAGVPNTGGEPMALVPAMLLLSGLALMAVTLRRKARKNEK